MSQILSFLIKIQFIYLISCTGLLSSTFALDAPVGNEIKAELPSAKRNTSLTPRLALGFPQLIQFGIQTESGTNTHFYADAGYFRFPPIGGKRTVQIAGFQGGVRYFPFNKVWYTSLGLGLRHVSLDIDMSRFKIEDETVATSGAGRLNTIYIVPKIGLSLPLSKRLNFEFDIGLQMALIYWGKLILYDERNGTSSENSEVLRVDSDRAMKRIAGLFLPEVTLFRLQWQLD